MDRWACVSVGALPLQLLLRRKREWRGWPVAVVSEDRPQGVVLWTNQQARRAGARVGQSYAVALSLARGLRADVVAEAEVQAALTELKTLLWKFSPHVEVADASAAGERAAGQGVFWLDASGLGRLYPKLVRWAGELRTTLLAQDFVASIVVGFSRFGTYAVARAYRAVRVFEEAKEERLALAGVPLSLLDIEPEFCDVLDKLGVRTVDGLLQLPATGLLARFGKNAYRIHQLAALELLLPFTPSPWLEPLVQHENLEEAESDATRLLFIVKRLLDALLPQLVLRAEALAALSITCKLDRAQGVLGPEVLRPAVPTLDVVQLMDIVRLRLETLSLEAGIIEITLEASGAPTTPEQLRVFVEQPRRDLAAANRALARLRAELGEDAVVQAHLSPGHLPEASFIWQPLREVKLPRRVVAQTRIVRLPTVAYEESAAASLERRPLIRRVFSKPLKLSAPARHLRDDGWLIAGATYGPVTHLAGPYIVSGGWWLREAHREYQFVLTRRGDLLWVYHDRQRRRLCLHGEVC
ncbi:MAG TPA: hypothetical protein VF331_00630 [Polyangiales bacterium]